MKVDHKKGELVPKLYSQENGMASDEMEATDLEETDPSQQKPLADASSFSIQWCGTLLLCKYKTDQQHGK